MEDNYKINFERQQKFDKEQTITLNEAYNTMLYILCSCGLRPMQQTTIAYSFLEELRDNCNKETPESNISAIEERAKLFSRDSAYQSSYEGYKKGASDQKKIDIEKAWNHFYDTIKDYCLETGQEYDDLSKWYNEFKKAMEE